MLLQLPCLTPKTPLLRTLEAYLEIVLSLTRRRLKKTVRDYNNLSDKRKTFTRQYGYDSEEMYLEFDENANLLARYIHSTLRTDDTLAMEVTASGVTAEVASESKTYVFIKDQIGSVVQIADTLGNIVQKYDYSGFGATTRILDSANADISNRPIVNNSFMFANRELDSEVNLYYSRARYLDAEIGRFISEDPYPGKRLNPFSVVNKYCYAQNNPSYYVDPSGEAILTTTVLIAALAAGIIGGISNVSGLPGGIDMFSKTWWRVFGLGFGFGALDIISGVAFGPWAAIVTSGLYATMNNYYVTKEVYGKGNWDTAFAAGAAGSTSAFIGGVVLKNLVPKDTLLKGIPTALADSAGFLKSQFLALSLNGVFVYRARTIDACNGTVNCVSTEL